MKLLKVKLRYLNLDSLTYIDIEKYGDEYRVRIVLDEDLAFFTFKTEEECEAFVDNICLQYGIVVKNYEE